MQQQIQTDAISADHAAIGRRKPWCDGAAVISKHLDRATKAKATTAVGTTTAVAETTPMAVTRQTTTKMEIYALLRSNQLITPGVPLSIGVEPKKHDTHTEYMYVASPVFVGGGGGWPLSSCDLRLCPSDGYAKWVPGTRYELVYLGGAITADRDPSIETTRRLQRAWACFQRYKIKIYDRPGVRFPLKVRLLKAEVSIHCFTAA